MAVEFFEWFAVFFAEMFEFLFDLQTGLGFSYGTLLLVLIFFDFAIWLAARALSNDNRGSDDKT